MMDKMQGIGLGVIFWVVCLTIYSAVAANASEKTWFMSFANSFLNGANLLLTVFVVIPLLRLAARRERRGP